VTRVMLQFAGDLRHQDCQREPPGWSRVEVSAVFRAGQHSGGERRAGGAAGDSGAQLLARDNLQLSDSSFPFKRSA
jgi:hypothetical protein